MLGRLEGKSNLAMMLAGCCCCLLCLSVYRCSQQRQTAICSCALHAWPRLAGYNLQSILIKTSQDCEEYSEYEQQLSNQAASFAMEAIRAFSGMRSKAHSIPLGYFSSLAFCVMVYIDLAFMRGRWGCADLAAVTLAYLSHAR